MKLIKRMPKMCKAFIKAKGNYFEEYKSQFKTLWYIWHFFLFSR